MHGIKMIKILFRHTSVMEQINLFFSKNSAMCDVNEKTLCKQYYIFIYIHKIYYYWKLKNVIDYIRLLT
jgi:hypothetical protein